MSRSKNTYRVIRKTPYKLRGFMRHLCAGNGCDWCLGNFLYGSLRDDEQADDEVAEFEEDIGCAIRYRRHFHSV